MSGWSVTARPVGKNEDSKNESHVLVLLRHVTRGEEKIAAVAIERKFADPAYRDKTFQEQLDAEVEKALHAVKALDDLTENAGKLV